MLLPGPQVIARRLPTPQVYSPPVSVVDSSWRYRMVEGWDGRQRCGMLLEFNHVLGLAKGRMVGNWFDPGDIQWLVPLS